MQDEPVLKLPLVGKINDIDCLNVLDKHIELPISDTKEFDELEEVEKALGDYLVDSKDYKKILDLFFPESEFWAVEAVENLVYKQSVEKAPLFTRIFLNSFQKQALKNPDKQDKQAKKDGNEKKELLWLRSAWSHLMLELGEFQLEEHFDRLSSEQLHDIINYTYSYSSPDSPKKTFNAQFDNQKKIISKIWERIVGDDTLIVFIDDNSKFGKRWGIDENPIKITDNPDTNNDNYKIGQKIWLQPSGKFPEKKIKQKIEKIIKFFEDEKSKPDKLLVFVVDLLYKKDGIDRIKGDDLIRFLRYDFKTNPLIIAFTAGQSPFVINSAVKGGADIVIMKERGKGYNVGENHGICRPSGLFDLLWALSKNINHCRFLRYYKKVVRKYIDNEDFNYKSVLDKLFLSIENESPFGRKYLRDFQRHIEDLRLKSILSLPTDE